MAWETGWEFLQGVGATDKFGHADYAAALREGKSKAQIRDYVNRASADQVLGGNQNLKDLMSQDSGFTYSLGQARGQGFGDQQRTHFGGADLLHAQATLADRGENPWSGAGALAIQQYIDESNAPRSSGFMNTGGYALQSAASGQQALNTAQTDAAAAQQWRADEAKKSADYYADMLKQASDDARLAREQQEAQAAKITHTGSSSVGLGTNTLGIRTARSKDYRSGTSSRGTAQFARSGKGSNITGINIA